MTPEQMIKSAILTNAIQQEAITVGESVDESNVDDLFASANDDWQLQDYIHEFREGDVETNIPAPSTRHYEAKSVAAKMPDGSWIGWTYWYGGGKHGEPEAIDWMDSAYVLTCIEEQKVVTARTFSVATDQAA